MYQDVMIVLVFHPKISFIGIKNNNPIQYSGEIYKLIFDKDYSYTTSHGIIKNT